MFGHYDRVTRDNLRAVLADMLAQPSGTSLRDRSAAADSVFQTREKAEPIAKTLSFGASNLANRRGMATIRRSENSQVVRADDAEMCGLCAKLNGKVVSVSDCFLKKGDILTDKNGASITILRNIEAPPLHEGCRCYCRPDGISSD